MNGLDPGMQRRVALALLAGMVLATVAATVVVEVHGGGLVTEPIPALDTVVLATAGAIAAGAFVARRLLHRRGDAAPAEARPLARFRAVVVPLAMLEGASMLGLVGFVAQGHAVPCLVVALVALSLAIALVPTADAGTDA